MTYSQYQDFLRQQEIISSIAKAAADDFHQLSHGDPQYEHNSLEAINDPYAWMECNEDSITFTADITSCGNTEREYFEIPTGFLFDREQWMEQYQLDRKKRLEDKALRDRQTLERKEAKERAVYERLHEKFGGHHAK